LELIALTKRLELSSLHVIYMTAEERDLAIAVGMLPDRGTHFVWENKNYRDFDAFLASLRNRRRKMIRRERRHALADGLSIDWLTCNALSFIHVDIFYDFYINTYKKYGQKHYLTRGYFERVFRNMPENILLILARRGNDYIGGALLFLSEEAIFIQHWGSREEVKFLYFETTFYLAIDYALSHGQKFIDAGAIGQQKAARGFLPADVYHAHWFRNPAFGELISKGLEKKSRNIGEEQATLMQSSPFQRETKGAK